MTHVIFWVVIGTAYLLSMILVCKCVSLADKKYVEVAHSPADARREKAAKVL